MLADIHVKGRVIELMLRPREMQRHETSEKATAGQGRRNLQIILQVDEQRNDNTQIAQIARNLAGPWIGGFEPSPDEMQPEWNREHSRDKNRRQPLIP